MKKVITPCRNCGKDVYGHKHDTLKECATGVGLAYEGVWELLNIAASQGKIAGYGQKHSNAKLITIMPLEGSPIVTEDPEMVVLQQYLKGPAVRLSPEEA